MKKDNLAILQGDLRYLGFGESTALNNELEQAMEKGSKEFELTTNANFDESCVVEAVLYFRWSDSLERYFFVKYTASILYNDTPAHNKTQTFYIVKGSGISFKEAYNLLQGRAVNKDLTNPDGEKYNAWIQLDFGERMPTGNYKVRQFRVQYGYDLEKILSTYPIKELEMEELRLNLIRSLKKGNLHPVTFAKQNKVEKMYIEACPRFKTISIYSQAVRAAQHLELKKFSRSK